MPHDDQASGSAAPPVADIQGPPIRWTPPGVRPEKTGGRTKQATKRAVQQPPGSMGGKQWQDDGPFGRQSTGGGGSGGDPSGNARPGNGASWIWCPVPSPTKQIYSGLNAKATSPPTARPPPPGHRRSRPFRSFPFRLPWPTARKLRPCRAHRFLCPPVALRLQHSCCG